MKNNWALETGYNTPEQPLSFSVLTTTVAINSLAFTISYAFRNFQAVSAWCLRLANTKAQRLRFSRKNYRPCNLVGFMPLYIIIRQCNFKGLFDFTC